MKFVLGRHPDPGDEENNLLRDIAGSLTVNADSRECVYNPDGRRIFAVRDISNDVANRLRRAGFPIFVRRTADPTLANEEERFKERLARELKAGNPDWNVIRKDDAGRYSPEELDAIYEEVVRFVEKEAKTDK